MRGARLAPSAERAFCFVLPRSSVPHAAKVAAALSAAVTTTKPSVTRPLQAEPSKKKHTRQTPAALREGVRGRRFSQRSGLPRRSPIPPSFQEGARGRGPFFRKAPSLAIPFYRFLPHSFHRPRLARMELKGAQPQPEQPQPELRRRFSPPKIIIRKKTVRITLPKLMPLD